MTKGEGTCETVWTAYRAPLVPLFSQQKPEARYQPDIVFTQRQGGGIQKCYQSLTRDQDSVVEAQRETQANMGARGALRDGTRHWCAAILGQPLAKTTAKPAVGREGLPFRCADWLGFAGCG